VTDRQTDRQTDRNPLTIACTNYSVSQKKTSPTFLAKTDRQTDRNPLTIACTNYNVIRCTLKNQ